MGKIHSHSRGKSHSTRPASIGQPSWVSQTPDEITSTILKLAKEEHNPSQIGVELRDEYGIPLAKPLIGKSIGKVLKENGLNPDIPEDLSTSLTRAGKLQSHLKAHPGDRMNVRSLELLEAKIHRLSKYYKMQGILPSTSKFSVAVAQLE